jgi:hypothetical protein
LPKLEAAWVAVDTDLNRLLTELGEYSADFSALQTLEANVTAFSDTEVADLRALLGMYGVDLETRLNGHSDLRCTGNSRRASAPTRPGAAARGSSWRAERTTASGWLSPRSRARK